MSADADADADAGPDALATEVRAAADGGADLLARQVAKARVARALFARDDRATVGRYHLLERVGAGGMGTVWGAWDPELERRVAIKVLHRAAAPDRERILREGQVLARLSHPNIVAIFDVGVVDDQVYLVMEWVRGTPLAAYATGARSARELVRVYRQACLGLAAAHAAGVIHRDFKPANAVVGDDGRVRVLDFGLATDTDAGAPARVAGTPRFMAPEQATGAAVTPAADQYAFCVSLRDAFAARGAPPPRWIAAIIARGTAAEPAARFSEMAALARALADDPGRRWRRRGVLAVAAASVGAAFAIGRARSTAPPAPRCTGAAAELAASWNPTVRDQVTAHVTSLGAYGARAAPRLADDLDGYAAGWIATRTDTCRAHDRGELPPAQYGRRVECLARAAAALAAAAEVMTAATGDGLGDALVAARALPSPAGCAAEDGARTAPPTAAQAARVTQIDGQLERARLLSLAGNAQAIDVAAAAAAAAEATGYAPLGARALAIHGWALRFADADAARALLDRAFHAALRADDDVLAVEAYARARFVASRRPDFVAPAPGERELVEDLAIRAGGVGRFGLALLYNNLATERLAADDRAGARALLRQAMAALPSPGDRAHDLELVVVVGNLALVEDQPARRQELSATAAARLGEALGDDHPLALAARIQLAVLTADPQAAAAAFAATCASIPAWEPALAAWCAYEQGWLAITRGDPTTAAAALQAVGGPIAADPAAEPAQPQIATAYLAIAGDDPPRRAAAITAMTALATARAGAPGWWNHADAADAWAIVALGEARRGRTAAAIRAWTAAAGLYADQAALERRRAHARDELAALAKGVTAPGSR